MSWKSFAITGLLCVLASPVFAAPTMNIVKGGTVSNGNLDANGNWVWKVTITPDLTLVPDTTGTPVAAELGFTSSSTHALPQGNVLGAAYTMGKVPFGLVVYRVAGGVLDGEWVSSGDPKAELGRETLEGPEKLGGTYKITLGQNRDGTTNYSGQVIIKPDGPTYLLAWMVPKLAYIGRGVRVGDVLVVAYGQSQDPKQLPGVVAYQIEDPNSMVGVWATAGVSATGSETLKRRP